MRKWLCIGPQGSAMSQHSITVEPPSETLQGLLCAVLAYLLWGMLPLFLKLIAHVSMVEVLAHRVLWSLPFAGLLLLATDRSGAMSAALRNPHVLLMACLTSVLICLNWGIYIWAIANDRTLDAALGYYINPLVSVLLGIIFLRERLKGAQIIAIVLAVIAVGLLSFKAGGVPWISLALAVSFAFYSYFRKTVPVGALQGFTLEVMLLSIPAIAYITWLFLSEQNHFGTAQPLDTLWLIIAGPVTAGPLILFTIGARRLRMSTLGLLQYIAPTMVFLTAVFIFNEPFTTIQAVAFGLIWIGLLIFTWSNIASHKVSKA